MNTARILFFSVEKFLFMCKIGSLSGCKTTVLHWLNNMFISHPHRSLTCFGTIGAPSQLRKR